MSGDRSDQILDELLILGCQAGDARAISELVARWHSRLLEFATVITRDREIAGDAVQEGWISIIRSLRQLHDPARYRGWMFRIVRHKCIDQIRHNQAKPGPGIEVDEPENLVPIVTASELDQFEHQEEISAVLDVMTPDHRTVLALHYLYEVEVTQMAEILEIPIGTVKSRLFKARSAFRTLFERGDGDEHDRRQDQGSTQGLRLVINRP